MEPSSIEFERVEESDRLTVFFGGIKGRIGIQTPPFEFVRISKMSHENKIFVRDLDQMWYHKGLRGHSKTISETAHFLREKINNLDVAHVKFVGNSAGGYAAILFGQLLNIDIVHSFSPQTYLGTFHRLLYRDRRWKAQMQNVHSASERILDLKSFLSKSRSDKPQIFIHYSVLHRLDRGHAERLRGIANTHLFGYQNQGHGLAIYLKEKDVLLKLYESNSLEEVQKIYNSINPEK